MLVGPSITLSKLEQHMKDRMYEIQMELPKLHKDFNQLREDFKRMPRTVVETKNDEEIEVPNPDFISIPQQMKVIETKIKDLQNQQELMEAKVDELDNIEERSQMGKGRRIDKETEVITLSLSDCLMLGIESADDLKK